MAMNASDTVKTKLPLALLIMAAGGGVWREYHWELVGIVAVVTGAAFAIGVLVETVDRLEREIRDVRRAQQEQLGVLKSLQSDQVRRRPEGHAE